MSHGVAHSDDLRRAWVHMSGYFSAPKIAEYTGYDVQSVQQVLADYKRYGTSMAQKRRKPGPKYVIKNEDM